MEKLKSGKDVSRKVLITAILSCTNPSKAEARARPSSNILHIYILSIKIFLIGVNKFSLVERRVGAASWCSHRKAAAQLVENITLLGDAYIYET